MNDLASSIKPLSKSRESFFNDVIDYANKFLTTHNAQMDMWRADWKVPSAKKASVSTMQKIDADNSWIADRLASLAKDEISEFFKIFLHPHIMNGDEV